MANSILMKVFNALTDVWKLFVQLGFYCFFVVVGNPLSLFFINLVMPSWAAGLTQFFATELCWQGLESFYCKLAQKMPYRWRKCWMKKSNLCIYSNEDQYRFFKEGMCSLNQISADAQKMYWRDLVSISDKAHRELRISYVDICGCSDEMFSELLSCVDYTTINHVARQTLNYNKMAMLVCFVMFADTRVDAQHNFAGKGSDKSLSLLLELVKRDGLDAKLVSRIEGYKEKRKEEVLAIEAALDIYRQKVFASTIAEEIKAEKGANAALENWRKFCQNTDAVYIAAQVQMDSAMYEVFHEVGLQMHAAAIVSFIQRSDIAVCKKIFEFEPEHGIINEEIRNVLYAVPAVHKQYISSL